MKSGYDKLEILPFQDARGQLKKIVQRSKMAAGEVIEEIYVLYSKTGTVRGNHYHRQTTEFFTVLSGEAKIAISDVDKTNINIITVKESDNITIKVYPDTVHSLKNESDNPLIILAVSLKEYDPQNTDTFPCVLMD